MGERYGARVGKAEIGQGFQKERDSVGVERTRGGREFGKERRDHGTSGRVLGCLPVSFFLSFNSINSISFISKSDWGPDP